MGTSLRQALVLAGLALAACGGGDTPASLVRTGTSDPGWAYTLEELRRALVRGSDFEVVASGTPTTC